MRIHTLFWAALSELASPRRCSECSEKLGLALSSSEFLGALGSEQLGVALRVFPFTCVLWLRVALRCHALPILSDWLSCMSHALFLSTHPPHPEAPQVTQRPIGSSRIASHMRLTSRGHKSLADRRLQDFHSFCCRQSLRKLSLQNSGGLRSLFEL